MSKRSIAVTGVLMGLMVTALAFGVPTSAKAEPVTAGAAAAAAAKAWAAERMEQNRKAAERESGFVDKMIRSGPGISMRDIREHGWKGGNESVIRKPLGSLGDKMKRWFR